MWLIAGLGNPGAKYVKNRHNVGFMAADVIAALHPSFGAEKQKFNARYQEGMIGGEKILLLKPQTFMNNSGQSVGEAARFYKVPTEKIIVLYDELDLEPGKVKIKQGGGNGGHNGLRSLDAHLEDKNYWRVRIGIGHPGHKDRVTGYVLGDFAKADEDWLADLLAELAHNIDLMLNGKPEQLMNRLAKIK